jgi:HTH-type transcriptional regulator / antitoxin HigA
MDMRAENQYIPDTVSAPGETLLETLGAFGISPSDLAERTGRSRKTINEIIEGKTPITTEMSLELEQILAVPASFWNNREHHYREARNRKSGNHTGP